MLSNFRNRRKGALQKFGDTMNPKKEPCRNFQRGSCQYGERCRFLHVIQQQNKPNPYGFGTQNGNPQQQQRPNPIGFGVQRGSQTKVASSFVTLQQNQLFENTWNRLNSAPTTTSSASRQSDTKQQQVNHKCSNSEACKKLIIDDLKNERPLWKLTCYGHCKGRPCDINGDISYEELQAAAYDDARRGLSVHSIVERERNLLNSKLLECENLLQQPYIIPSNTIATNSFHVSDSSFSATSNQKAGPPSVSSFSQLGAFVNLTSNRLAPSNGAHGQSSPFPTATPVVGPTVTNDSQFGGSGFLNAQTPPQPFGNYGSSNLQNFNAAPMIMGNNFFSAPLVVPQNSTALVNNQFSKPFETSSPTTNELADLFVNQHIQDKMKDSKDSSIWLKAEWKRGEIPEEAPPDEFI